MSDQLPKPAYNRPFYLFLILFLVLNGLLLAVKYSIKDLPLDYRVLFAGNLILFLATVISYRFYKKALTIRAQAFVRMVYGAMLAKMAICLLAFIAYVLIAGHQVNKWAVYGCFILYFIYSFAEMKILLQYSKLKKNA